jgi:hypothetical protein
VNVTIRTLSPEDEWFVKISRDWRARLFIYVDSSLNRLSDVVIVDFPVVFGSGEHVFQLIWTVNQYWLIWRLSSESEICWAWVTGRII